MAILTNTNEPKIAIEIENISKQSGIYKFVNKIKNKVYIGQAINLQKRIKEHLRDYKKNKFTSYFYNSIKKHGIENFKVEILQEGNFTKTELDQMEIRFIELFKSNNSLYGYNMTSGGDGVIGRKGYKRSEETKQKISKAKKGKKHTVELKEKNRQGHLGKKASEETKKKMSKSQKARKPRTNETRKKLSQANLGRKHTEESKNKMRKFRLGKKLSPESIKKREETKRFNKNMKLIKENNFVYDWLYV